MPAPEETRRKDPRNERLIVRRAFRCPECGQTWTTDDDPNEWAYGHDCEV
jgi:hypothetical protein